MKRKLALLLAVSMILSMVPMNMSLFATSSNNLSKVPTVVSERAAFVESDLLPSQLVTRALEIDKNDDGSVKYVVDGTYLQIEPSNTITPGSTVKLTLENARWFFTKGHSTSSKWNGLVTGTALTVMTDALYDTYNRAYVTNDGTQNRALGNENNRLNLYRTWRKYEMNQQPTKVYEDNIANAAALAADQIADFDSNVYVRFAANDAVSSGAMVKTNDDVSLTNTSASFAYDINNQSRLVLYRMTMSGADVKEATVTFPNTINEAATGTKYDKLSTTATKKIPIPLVVRSTSDDSVDVKVTLTDNNLTSISGGSWVFGTTSSTLTNTYVNDPQTARDEFPLDRIVIKEQRVGSMGSGTIRITAPSGFEFSSDALKDVQIIAENFNYGAKPRYDDGAATNGLLIDTRSETFGAISSGYYENADVKIGFRQVRSDSDYSVIEIVFKTLSENKSSRVAGSVYIRDGAYAFSSTNHTTNHLRLIADEGAAWGDVMLKITNGSGSDVVTEQTFKAGTRKDWTIDFQALGTIPTLVNGRYYQDDSVYAEDEEHLTAEIKFYENTVNAWWSGRYTNFTLPEGVKFRKVEITKAKKVTQEDELRNDKRTTTPYSENYYMNSGKKDGYVTISGNVLTINNVQVETNEKAQIEMKLWVSIESGFEGDVTLTCDGSGIADELDPIVIAKAVNPVDIVTTVTDVRIGYQYYQVADVELVETGAGMLEKNKQVWLTVTDRINTDMYFTPGFKWEVTEGNIKIKNVDLGTGSKIYVGNSKIRNSSTSGDLGSGTIVFDVDSVSSTASTIKFSNLQLKIDRTVPESSQEHYSVYAWGPNVAPNADIFDYSRIYTDTGVTATANYANYVGNDQHTALGIHVPFVRVVTSAIDKNNILSSVVKITAGSTTAYVNGDAVTVDPAPFIDAATSRFQVPVRAIATLLGIREEQILWSDADRTVTINMVNRTIQFAIGSDLMLVNGAQVRMDTAAMIVNGRTFIPFKYLGDALGVTVGYDDATKTATYNDAE